MSTGDTPPPVACSGGDGTANEARPNATPSQPEVAPRPPDRRKRGRVALVVALTLATIGTWYFFLRGPTDDLGRFQGEWQIAVPAMGRDRKPGVRLKPVTIRVTGEHWAYLGDGKELSKYRIALRTEASPKEIDLVRIDRDNRGQPDVLHGIYEISSGRAKVALVPAAEPRPTTFDAEDAPPALLLEKVR